MGQSKKDSRSHGEKVRDTLIGKYGEDYYSTIGSKGGRKSNNRPFKDNPSAARKAVNARWERYRAAKAAEAVDVTKHTD